MESSSSVLSGQGGAGPAASPVFVRRDVASNGVVMPTQQANFANGAAAAPRSPIGSSMSRFLLASLIEAEKKDTIDVADQMMGDYQVKLAMLVLAANIQAVPVQVTVKSGDQRAKFLAELLLKLWRTNLATMLRCVWEGRVAWEKVWRWDSANRVNTVSLQDLPYRQTEMVLDNGNFNGIVLRGKAKKEQGGKEEEKRVEIPASKSWWLALDSTAVEPYGKSRLLGAPQRVYKERDAAIKLRAMFVKRMVLNGGVAHVPSQAVMENGQSVDVFQEMGKAHDARLSGGLLILDNARDENGNYLYDVTDPGGVVSPAPIDDHIDGLDSEQLLAFGIPPKTVTEGESTGSFAMVSQQRMTLDAVVEGILLQLEASFQKYVIDKVSEINFGPGNNAGLAISHDPLLSPENAIVSQLVQAMLTSPQLPEILKSGAVDLRAILEKSRVPLLPGARDAISKLIAAAQSAIGEGGGAANGGANGGGNGPGSPVSPGSPEGTGQRSPLNSPGAGLSGTVAANLASSSGNFPESQSYDLNCGANAKGGGGFQQGNTCGGNNSESSRNDGELPPPKIGDKLIRYIHRDGTGLMNNNGLNRMKLTDDEEFELIDLMDFGLKQPGRGVTGTFYFTEAGTKKHKRLIRLLRKASKTGVVRKVTRLKSEPNWVSTDGQVAVSNVDSNESTNLANSGREKFVPPVAAREAAQKVLQWKEEHGDEVDAMEMVGWARTNQLAKGGAVSLKTVKRMARFWRHKDNSQIKPEYKKTPWKDRGYVCWLGWGGDAGIAWARRIVRKLSAKQRLDQ